ncbi:MAG: hypothetical protein ABSF70_12915, partial [Terracidiphilus sp.]
MQIGSREIASTQRNPNRWKSEPAPIEARAVLALLASTLFLATLPAWAVPAEDPDPPLPEAPLPANPTARPLPVPCSVVPPAEPAAPTTANPSETSGQSATQSVIAPQTPPCKPHPPENWFERFLTGPEVKPMTPKEKAQLAARNVLDPFNAVTILGNSAITIGSDAD